MEKFNGLTLDCATSQEAWEKVNEYLFLNEKDLKDKGAGRDGNASVSYDNFIYIRKAWVDPNFDFGRMFGYRVQKWTHLVNNYVDMNYLDLVKQDVTLREMKKQRMYNVTKHFANSHTNGKDCLISLTFSRRTSTDAPVLIFHTRASEITKRLLIDLLLVQRMGEYVYGNNDFSIMMYSPMMYLNIEAFTMYHTHRNLKKLLKKHYGEGKDFKFKLENRLEPFQKRVMGVLDKFLTCHPMDIKYKSHRRAVKQLQTDDHGKPLSGDRPMTAGQLYLETRKIIYPDNILSDKKRAEYRKQMKKKTK